MKIEPPPSRFFRSFVSRHLLCPLHISWLRFFCICFAAIISNSLGRDCSKFAIAFFQISSWISKRFTWFLFLSSTKVTRLKEGPPVALRFGQSSKYFHFLASIILYIVWIPFCITKCLGLKKMNVQLRHLWHKSFHRLLHSHLRILKILW